MQKRLLGKSWLRAKRTSGKCCYHTGLRLWTVNFQMTQNNEVWVGEPGFNTSVVVPFPAETVNGRPKRFLVVFVPNQFTSTHQPTPKLLLTPELRKSIYIIYVTFQNKMLNTVD